MHAMRKFFSPWKALVAAIAVFASAGSAKADLSLSFTSGSVTKSVDTSVIPLENGSSGTLTVGDFTVKYTVISALTAAPGGSPSGMLAMRELSIKLEATNNNLTSTKKLTATLGGTSLEGPGNGLGYIQAGVAVDPLFNHGTYSTMSDYDDSVGGLGSASVLSTTTSLKSSFATITINNPYNLTTTSIEAAVAANSKVVVTGSTYVYGVPEPSGIAAALAGVPCLGLLLGTIRRRLTGNPAPTA